MTAKKVDKFRTAASETGKNNTLRGLFSLFLLEAMEIIVTFANKSGLYAMAMPCVDDM